MSCKHQAIAVTAVVLAVTAGVAAPAARPTAKGCPPWGTLVGSTVRFCGPGTAALSIFPGVRFTSGSCSTKRSGNVVFSLKLGLRTRDARNSGRKFFALVVTGSLSHPTGGNVTAFSGGKLWIGAGTSFRGNTTSGSFTARGLDGHMARGTYHC